ncbi:MAG TPA: hypothetical protein VFT95_06450 [Micromonosporaceae bacterium]|nr:hypothetical protein [Micromonosporaceae bacterium]
MTQPPYGGHVPDDPRYPTSDPPFPTSGQPYPGDGPVPGPPPLPTSGQPFPTSGAPDPTASSAVERHASPAGRRRLLVGGAIALVLVLCVGGGISAWLLLRGLESGDGAAGPVDAAEGFLTAVYSDKDSDKAAGLVCSEARDEEEIAAKVAEVKAYDTKYDSPRFEWAEPTVEDTGEDRAVVTVRLKLTTADEKTAEQELHLTVVRKSGWWVCEVS